MPPESIHQTAVGRLPSAWWRMGGCPLVIAWNKNGVWTIISWDISWDIMRIDVQWSMLLGKLTVQTPWYLRPRMEVHSFTFPIQFWKGIINGFSGWILNGYCSKRLLGASQESKVGNVNPGLINHGLLIRGYPPNSHNMVHKWYPSN